MKKILFIAIFIFILSSFAFAKDFTDLTERDWSYSIIKALSYDGIIDGYANGTFKPINNISKAEFLKLLIETCYDEKIEILNDKHWATNYVDFANNKNLLQNLNFSENELDKPIKRVEMAELIANASKGFINDENKPDISLNFKDIDDLTDYQVDTLKYINKYNLIAGYDDYTFRPNTFTSRQDAVTIIYRLYHLLLRNTSPDETTNSTKAQYIKGLDFNNTLRILAGGNASDGYASSGLLNSLNTISGIEFVKTKPTNEILSKAKNVGLEKEGYEKIYAWYDNGIILIWSDADYIYFNDDCSKMFAQIQFYNFSPMNLLNKNNSTSNIADMNNMFYNCIKISYLDLSAFDTSNVTNMSGLFKACFSLVNINVSSFDTKKVTSMSSMFSGCNKLINIDLSNFDTSNVESMTGMFSSCGSLQELDIKNFNTSKVNSMMGMFDGCSSLRKLDLTNFDTSNVTNMSDMFYCCYMLKDLDFSSFNTQNVTNMLDMFTWCNSMESIDLSSFNTKNVTNFRKMFQKCDILKTIYVSDEFVVSKSALTDDMFIDSKLLVGGAGTIYNPSFLDGSYAHIDGGTSNPGYFTLKAK